MDLTIRWMTRSDLPAVETIDAESFPADMAWNRLDFDRVFDGRHFALVAVHKGKVVGYVVSLKHHSRPTLVSIAVRPQKRRRGIATALFNDLTRRHAARSLTMISREDALDYQLWLRSLGAKCSAVKRGYFDGTAPDAYEFTWTRPVPVK